MKRNKTSRFMILVAMLGCSVMFVACSSSNKIEYSLNVVFGSELTSANYGAHYAEVKSIIENYSDENGVKYGLTISQAKMQGAGDTASVLVRYIAVADEFKMLGINDGLIKELENRLFSGGNKYIGRVEISSKKIK